jgi:integrase
MARPPQFECPDDPTRPHLAHLKTDESRRTLPLGPEVASAIAKRLQAQMAAGRSTPESFVFTSPNGMPVRYSNLMRRWRRPLLESAKIEAEKAAHERGDLDYRFPVEAGLYDLRHTAIENLKAPGVPLDVIHVLAGHRSIHTTLKHYNKPTELRRREAATLVSEWLSQSAVATR